MTSTPMVQPGGVRAALADAGLGTVRIMFFQLGAAAPLMVVAAATTTAFAVTGVRGIPLAFVLVGVALGFALVGYVAMARRIANAGALYTYITRGLGRPAGVGAALAALLAYNALQISLYGGLGAVMAGAATAWWHLSLPWWVWALGAAAGVALCGIRGVQVNAFVLAALLLIEVTVVVVFDAVFVTHPAGGHLTWATLSPTYLRAPGWGAALVLALTAYTGVEQAVTYSEEARRPQRTIPRATFLVLALIAVVYAGSSWAMSVAVGADQIVPQAQAQQTGLVFSLAARFLGAWVATAANALLLTSMAASLLAFHNTVARYSFALGRERVLPAWFARTGRRSGAPLIGSLTQSALAVAVIVAVALAHLDPLVTLFFQGGMLGGFGALTLFAVTSAAVIGFFHRIHRADPHTPLPHLWQRAIAPAAGAVMLAAAVYLALDNFAVLLGVTPTNPWRWILPALYLLLPTAGIGYALWLRAHRPAVYRSIGLGPDAVTAQLASTVGWAAEATEGVR